MEDDTDKRCIECGERLQGLEHGLCEDCESEAMDLRERHAREDHAAAMGEWARMLDGVW